MGGRAKERDRSRPGAVTLLTPAARRPSVVVSWIIVDKVIIVIIGRRQTPLPPAVPGAARVRATGVVSGQILLTAVAALPLVLAGAVAVARVFNTIGNGVGCEAAGDSAEDRRDHARAVFFIIAAVALGLVLVAAGGIRGLAGNEPADDSAEEAGADARGRVGKVVLDDVAGARDGARGAVAIAAVSVPVSVPVPVPMRAAAMAIR